MQKIVLILSFVCSTIALTASTTPPERVLPLSHSIQPIEYYHEQMLIWEDHINTHQNDAEAWLYYYTAARNINILNGQPINDLASIAEGSKATIPSTFEAHYIQYRQSGLFDRDYEELLQAHAIAPERWEPLHDLLHYYEVRNDQKALNTYAHRIYESGHLSPGVLDWNYNALMSISQNGILLTHGDNDTYPAWVLQQVRDIRADIKVVNIYLLLAEDAYRKRVFEDLGITNSFQKQVNQNVDTQLKQLVNHLFNYCDRALFLGVAIPSSLRKELGGDLYLTGLAFQHSQKNIDNLAILDHHYQNDFRTESLLKPLAYDPAQSVVDHMNMNYIPSFALLYKYYLDNNRTSEAEQTKTLITEIATRASKLDKIETIFPTTTEHIKKTEAPFSVRDLDKNLISVTPGFYASAMEVTNEMYGIFLEELLHQKKYDILNKCQIHPTDWRSYLEDDYKDLGDNVIYNQGHPDNPQAPIVNISHEAAQLYCQWLTTAYNQSDYKKKRFQEVRFRLPTNEEWTITATSNKQDRIYPWNGAYYRNAKGCLLANFDPSVEMTNEKTESTGIPADDDGAFFTVIVDAYFPNDIGCYNMSGNVAEMIDTEGITRGGGWNDPSYYMQTNVEKEETTPSANVGFRVFMDVIRE